MSFEPDNDLQRALERLSIARVWERAGLANPPRDGCNVVVKSPFREDRSGKAFSIFKTGLAAKDHGTGEGFNVFTFAERATGLSGRELVDRLCEWAGVSRTVRVREQLRAAQDAAAEGRVIELAPEVKRLIRRQEKQDAERAAEVRLAGERRAALLPKTARRPLAPWSEAVRGRFLEGWQAMKADGTIAEKLAKERGWPVAWVQWLHRMGLVAAPWVPWCVAGERRAQRGKAFRVDEPFLDSNHVLHRRPVGYHQRFFTLGEKLADGSRGVASKQWTYVPYMPPAERQQTEFQRAMVAAELERGGEIGAARLAAVPFALGDFTAPGFLVITEGQWDAVTIAGAAGWLDIDQDEWGVAVLGARGNEGGDTLLAYYGEWIARHRPRVLVLADNDAAGRKWDGTEVASPGRALAAAERPVREDGRAMPPVMPRGLGQAAAPSLCDKLRAAGARDVQIFRVKKELGKDFNDYWRARAPARDAVAGWLRGLGVAV